MGLALPLLLFPRRMILGEAAAMEVDDKLYAGLPTVGPGL